MYTLNKLATVISIFLLGSTGRLTQNLLQSACLRNANMEPAQRETADWRVHNKREDRIFFYNKHTQERAAFAFWRLRITPRSASLH